MKDLPVIAIVDDDASVRRALVRLFSSVGLAAETFPSAKAFLDHPVSLRPMCLVLDIRLPGPSGLDLQDEAFHRDNPGRGARAQRPHDLEAGFLAKHRIEYHPAPPPPSHSMPFQVFDSLTKEKRPFEPLEPPLVLNGGFGEYRSNHFHAGLDLGTGARVGRPVYAPADGWIERVRAGTLGAQEPAVRDVADQRVREPQAVASVDHLHGLVGPAAFSLVPGAGSANASRLYHDVGVRAPFGSPTTSGFQACPKLLFVS